MRARLSLLIDYDCFTSSSLIEGGVVLSFFFAVEITTHCRPLTYCSKLVSSKTIVRLISPDDKLNVASTRCTSDSNVRWVAFHLTPTEARIRGSRWTWPVVWINLTSHLWAFSDVYKKYAKIPAVRCPKPRHGGRQGIRFGRHRGLAWVWANQLKACCSYRRSGTVMCNKNCWEKNFPRVEWLLLLCSYFPVMMSHH